MFKWRIIHICKNKKMSTHKVAIKSVTYITHDVIRIVTEKPSNYTFTPGQTNDVAMDKEGW
jgi:hypothetical protein